MSTASALAKLLQVESDLNYYTQQQIWYANKHTDMSAKVARYAKYEEKWEEAYDECMYAEEGKQKTINGRTYSSGNEAAAEEYAYAKVQQRDEEVYLELTDKDMEYDTMQEMYNTLCEELRAEKEKDMQEVSTEAQNTHLLGS